jgi:hypothetical protein
VRHGEAENGGKFLKQLKTKLEKQSLEKSFSLIEEVCHPAIFSCEFVGHKNHVELS